MRTPASIGSHPIHPMLITIPIGLWAFSFVSDLIYLYTDDAVWRTMAFYTLGGGIIGALLASLPGLVDVFSDAVRPVRRLGLTHMAINVLVVVLMAVNFYFRYQGDRSSVPLIMSGVALLMLGISGVLGARMVHRYGIGVDTDSPELQRLSAQRAYGAR